MYGEWPLCSLESELPLKGPCIESRVPSLSWEVVTTLKGEASFTLWHSLHSPMYS